MDDRIQFRAPLKTHQIPNGALGTIVDLDQNSGQVTIALDAGTSLSTRFSELRHIEYGYATTSHSSQGATIDRVLVNVDTEQSVALVNQQQYYVSISRAREDTQVFTNKQDELAQAVSRAWPKSTALDAITPLDGSPRVSAQRHRGTPQRMTVRREGQVESPTRQTPERAPVTRNRSEHPLTLVRQLHPVDTAQLVSHQQKTDWRRERPDPVHEQAMTRTPAERRSELPAPQREEMPKQQPEHSRGIRYSR